MTRKGETVYSLKIEGTPRNYNWPVRFDLTDGLLGIDQYEDGKVKERVLLSKHQVVEMLAFLTRHKAAKP